MIANRKKKNFFLLLQLFISFLALFFFVGMNLKKFSYYFKPLNYDHEDIWVVDVDMASVPEERRLELSKLIQQKLQDIKEVEAVSRTNTVPFHHWGEEEKIEYNKQVSKVRAFGVDERYKEVLGLKLIKGRWFEAGDFTLHTQPIVVTRDMAEREFKDQDPLGKKLLLNGKPAVVVGVSDTFRENVSAIAEPGFFFPLQGYASQFILKSPRVGDIQLMDEQVRKAVMPISTDALPIRQNISLSLLKKYAHKLDYLQLTIAFVVLGFLVLNVFLGVSGMFSYNISQRRAEVGLRVAMGAKPSDILKQFLGETVILTTLGIAPGILVALHLIIIQYFAPYMDTYYGVLGIIISAVFLYLLMLSCAVYPSLKASRIQPATALHED